MPGILCIPASVIQYQSWPGQGPVPTIASLTPHCPDPACHTGTLVTMKTTLNITYYEPYGRLECHGQWRLFGVKEMVFS